MDEICQGQPRRSQRGQDLSPWRQQLEGQRQQKGGPRWVKERVPRRSGSAKDAEESGSDGACPSSIRFCLPRAGPAQRNLQTRLRLLLGTQISPRRRRQGTVELQTPSTAVPAPPLSQCGPLSAPTHSTACPPPPWPYPPRRKPRGAPTHSLTPPTVAPAPPHWPGAPQSPFVQPGPVHHRPGPAPPAVRAPKSPCALPGPAPHRPDTAFCGAGRSEPRARPGPAPIAPDSSLPLRPRLYPSGPAPTSPAPPLPLRPRPYLSGPAPPAARARKCFRARRSQLPRTGSADTAEWLGQASPGRPWPAPVSREGRRGDVRPRSGPQPPASALARLQTRGPASAVGGQGRRIAGGQGFETSLSNTGDLIGIKNKKFCWVWWCPPVIPATWEAEVGGSLELGSSKLQ
ncbi:uncharacterized protein LOC129052047 [Pongo abelii]|uniref:uncharacterized protein LOC129052047 n=1 Tax=Pongo abelii TaxID=9601 RepID=UPI0030071F60